jgi:hypothetical protein
MSVNKHTFRSVWSTAETQIEPRMFETNTNHVLWRWLFLSHWALVKLSSFWLN